MGTMLNSLHISFSSRWLMSAQSLLIIRKALSLPAMTGRAFLKKTVMNFLTINYRHILEKLGQGKRLLGLIFGKAQNKFQDPAKLRRLIVDLIDKEDWSSMSE